MSETLKGIKIKDLFIFKKTLQEWIKLNVQFVNLWKVKKDIPWWYNERAVLSVLAGAIWHQKEAIAFEEYSISKRWREKGRSTTYPGRQDIYIKIGKTEFICEVKDTWSGATEIVPSRIEKAKRIEKIKKKLNLACSDIRSSPSNSMIRVGILFIKPYINNSLNEQEVNERIKSWLDMITDHNNIEYSCCAWVFPKESRMFKGKYSNIYPGTVLLLRKI